MAIHILSHLKETQTAGFLVDQMLNQETAKSTRLSWRKGRGLPRRWFLYKGSERLATCEQTITGQWFWIGLGRAAAGELSTLDFCKSQIMSMVKQWDSK